MTERAISASVSSGLRGADGGSGWESNPPLQVSTLQPDGFEGRAGHQTRIASRRNPSIVTAAAAASEPSLERPFLRLLRALAMARGLLMRL